MASYSHTSVFDWGDQNAWETDFRSPAFGGDSVDWSDNVHFCDLQQITAAPTAGGVFNIYFTAQQQNCFGSL